MVLLSWLILLLVCVAPAVIVALFSKMTGRKSA